MQFLSLKSAGVEDLSSGSQDYLGTKWMESFEEVVTGWEVHFSWQEGRSWRGYEVFLMGLSLHAHLETPSLGLKARDPV